VADAFILRIGLSRGGKPLKSPAHDCCRFFDALIPHDLQPSLNNGAPPQLFGDGAHRLVCAPTKNPIRSGLIVFSVGCTALPACSPVPGIGAFGRFGRSGPNRPILPESSGTAFALKLATPSCRTDFHVCQAAVRHVSLVQLPAVVDTDFCRSDQGLIIFQQRRRKDLS
jgi:hypothetical protein